MVGADIRRAVSLYSLQNEYMTGRMKLDAIFAFLSQNGIDAFEILPDQMLQGSPDMSPEDIRAFRASVEKHGLTPVCADIFMNTNLYRNRTLRKSECVDLLRREIRQAYALGIPLIRLVSMVPSDMLEPVLPLAEELGITLALEIHAAMGFGTPKTDAFIAEMKRLSSEYLGLVIDTGLFCRRLPRVVSAYSREVLGVSQGVIDYLDALYAQGSDPLTAFHGSKKQFPEELRAMFRGEQDFIYAVLADGYENRPLSVLDPYMPFVKHFHFKLFEMLPDGTEYSVTYQEIVDYLKEKGFRGYVATEYEGTRWTMPDQPVMEKEQVLAHQGMLRALLTEGGGHV